MNLSRKNEHGAVDGKLIGLITFGSLFLVAGGLSIWLYINYIDAKENVDSKVEVATAEAVKVAKEELEVAFAAREKEPMRQFAGPDDYGRLTFDYPKTWSVYQATDISKSGATYAAYLNPVYVPPVPTNALSDLVANKKETPSETAVSKFAVRIKIEQKSYDDSLAQYEPLLKTGQITSEPFVDNNNGLTGTRYVGRFNNDIRGQAVVIKMRDRTLTMRTDADVFVTDFNALMKTVNFNQ